MSKPFHELKVGDKFQISRKNIGSEFRNYGPKAIQKFIKIDLRTAKCIDQIGYGNTHAVGSERHFQAYHPVESI